MKLLDLFCGMGGWSIGFHREGFECIGIDIVDVGYPYDLILRDIRDLQPNGERFDVVVASPPCTEFSTLTNISVARGQRPPKNHEKGLDLVRHAKRVIDAIDPKFWIIENVHGALKPFYPVLGSPRCNYGPWKLWGEFPASLIPDGIKKWGTGIATTGLSEGRDKGSWLDRRNRDNPWVSWKRAKIPLPLSLAIAQACKEKLTRN